MRGDHTCLGLFVALLLCNGSSPVSGGSSPRPDHAPAAGALATLETLPGPVPDPRNPLIQGQNVFAPHLLPVDGVWYCYYGGWQEPGQTGDTIYLVTSTAPDARGPWSRPTALVAPGEVHMVNDASVARDERGTWHMLYTLGDVVPAPPPLFDEWIGYSSSNDGLAWTPDQGSHGTRIRIRDPDSIGPGTLTGAARPALVRDGDLWRLYFDADTDRRGIPDSFAAVCTDHAPRDFRIVHKYPRDQGFPGFWEPDVRRRADGTFTAVVQRRFQEVCVGHSPDGVHFQLRQVLDVNSPGFGRKAVSNPGLIHDPMTDRVLGLAFGMTDSPVLIDHDIGFAFWETPTQ